MKLAELIIQLSANTASLRKDFEQAKNQAAEFAGSIKSLLGNLGVGLGLAGITEALRGLVDYEHEMSDVAAATGMTVKQISGFSFALKSTGIPLNELQLGLAQFDKIISGLMRSKAGAMAIKELDLSLAHLKSVGAHEALLEIADAFKKLPDGTEKAGIASALFTSTLGQKLIPILDEGRTGIEALEAEAQKLGFTLTDADAKAADQTYMAFQQLSAEMRGMEISAGTVLFPSLIFLSELLTGDANAALAAKDRLEEFGLEAAKLATYLDPLTAIFGGGARNSIQKHIDQIATEESIARDDMMRKLQALTIPGISPQGMMSLPGIGAAKVHIDKVSSAIRDLKSELAGLSEGPIAKGMDRLKNLGASPAQLEQGKALLEQIQSLKATQKAQGQLADADREYDRIVDSLSDSITHLGAAQKEYIKTVSQLNLLESKGVEIKQGLALAQQRYQETLLGQIQTPAQAGYGKAAAQGGSGKGFLDMMLTGSSGVPAETRMMKLGDLAQQLGKKMQDGFTGMIVYGQNFSSVLTNLTTLFAEFILKAVVFKDLANALGGGTSGGGTGFTGLLSSFFGGLAGGRASGGPVTAGQLYMVGESGPELFAPGMSGSIIPNAVGSARSTGTTVNIDARGADAGVEQRVYRAMQAMQKQTLGQSLVMNYEYQARGGTL